MKTEFTSYQARNAQKAALVTNQIKRIKRERNINPASCTMAQHESARASAQIIIGVKSHRPLKGDKYELKSAEIINWVGYDQGAVPRCAVRRVKIDRSGNTWILSLAGRLFNVHPKQDACALNWVLEDGFRIEQGCFPIRWEVKEWEFTQNGLNAESYFDTVLI